MMGSIEKWLREGQQDEQFLISDIAKHGCEGGIGGLIYYDEVVAFYAAHEANIWEILVEAAEAAGEPVLKMVSDLIADKVTSTTTFKNYVVWLAVEIKAQELMEEQEAA